MTGGNIDRRPDPDEGLVGSEQQDEDELRVDPLEAGREPPEHWVGADKRGTTPFEQRHGQALEHRLAEEEPDTPPRSVDDVPHQDAPRSGDPIDAETEDSDGPAQRRGQAADEAGGSVADAIRTPIHPDRTPHRAEGED